MASFRWCTALVAATLSLSLWSGLLIAADEHSWPKTLRVGLLPGESAPTVMRLNEPLRQHLEEALGMPVELHVGANYAATGEALRFGRLDIAYLGPVMYILQSRRVQLEPFARPTHAQVGPTFQAVIIVPKDSSLKTLEELKDKEVAMGDPASTSGTWVPRFMLADKGLVANKDYTLRVLGAHDAVALAVASGKVDAGGLSRPIYQRLLKEGRIDADKVRVLQASPAIPEYMWTFREGLHPELKEKIRQAFVSTHNPASLAVFRATAFIPSVDADVDRVRHWISVIEHGDPKAERAVLK